MTEVQVAAPDTDDTPDFATVDERLAVPAPNRRLPWAELATGTANGDRVSSQVMLERAGLDWEVGIRPLKRRLSSGRVVDSPIAFETYRMDDPSEPQLGTVKSRYEVLQNREAFDFGDSLVEGGVGHWTHAGMQQDGKKLFMTMLLEDEFQVLGQNPFKVYLFFSGAHDGSRSLKCFVTPVNVFCTNQTRLVKATNIGEFAIRHTSAMREKLEEAGEAIRRSGQYSNLIKAEAERLAAVRLTDDKARYILRSVIPDSRPKKDDMIAGILHTYQVSPTMSDYRGTGWGLLNATTEYMDHVKNQRTANARFESITFGEGAKYRLRLAEQLAEQN